MEITNLGNEEAKKYFLKNENYFNGNLPQYFNFERILEDILDKTDNIEMGDLYKDKKKHNPKFYENINYTIVSNKNGKYDWRPLELIHPYLYVELVKKICEKANWEIIVKRLKDFKKNPKIKCISIPQKAEGEILDIEETISNWWKEFEQESISLALSYEYMGITDVANCYSSIYTHTIPWALHSKEIAKSKQNDKSLIGNFIDSKITEMSYGQTNGIPQGSTLMDLIAEIIFGYADEMLTEKLKELDINEYTILRYRDDYRIFTNNKLELELILKELTLVLESINFKLNDKKTLVTESILENSIKKDKFEFIEKNLKKEHYKGTFEYEIQSILFSILMFAKKYKNASSLTKMLKSVYMDGIIKLKKKPSNTAQLISIIVEIILENPRYISNGIGIISKLFTFMENDEKKDYLKKIRYKFSKIPNTTYLEIWLQRLTIKNSEMQENISEICKLVDNKTANLWCSEWLDFSIDEKNIIDKEKLENMDEIIDIHEITIFNNKEYEQ